VYEQVATVREDGGRRIHRFQAVRERRRDGGTEEWVVVGFGDGTVRLADPEFERTREVAAGEFRGGRFQPLVAGGVPVWGY
jgi:hypothetical protein